MRVLAVLVLGFTSSFLPAQGDAQDVPAVTIQGGTIQVAPGQTLTPEQLQALQQSGMTAGAALPAGATPNPAAKKPEGDKKDGAKKEGDKKDANKEKKDDGPKVVKRGDAPATNKNSQAKLLRKPNDKISFSFVGAKWLDIMEVLADYSGMSLDWQQLPGDYLNFTTVREYTIPEARDEINRFLIARGYTMLVRGESLRVVKIDSLNKAMIPRVTAEQLDERMPHEFVKVSFQLDWLIAEDSVKEFSPMLSPHGKLFPLSNTNRLEAVDTVINLREIRDVIRTEQSSKGQEKLVRVFTFRHRRAQDAIELMRQLFDVKPPPSTKGGGGSMSSSQMRQMQQMMQQMQQAKAAGGAKGAQRDTKITMVLNNKDNSVLVKAPVDKMAEIQRAYEEIDRQQDPDASLTRNLAKMNTYRLESFDAEALVEMLNEIGELSPSTHLTIDKQKNTIIAYATITDHFTIKSLVDKLDNSYRRFHVIRLRRLQAEYVAGTIEFLLGEEKEEDSSSSRYMMRYYGGYGEQKPKERKFAVDADIENNRLMLFANQQEVEQINELLVKLGEVPSPDSPDARRRILTIDPELNGNEFLQRLQKMWPGKNPLRVIPVPEKPADQEAQTPQPEEPQPAAPATNKATAQQYRPTATVPVVHNTVDSDDGISTTASADANAFVPKSGREISFRNRRQVGNPSYARKTIRPESKSSEANVTTSSSSVVIAQAKEPASPAKPQNQDTEESDDKSEVDDKADADDKPEAVPVPSDANEKQSDELSSDSPPAAVPNTSFDPPQDVPPPVVNPKYQAKQPAATNQSSPENAALPPRQPQGMQGFPGGFGSRSSAPITVTITPSGELMFACDDPDVLYEFEQFVQPFARPKQDYKLFHLKFASPGWVSLTLEEYFEKQNEKKQILDWWGDVVDTGDQRSNRLSKKRMPKFISDTYTSTILVQNADAAQLATITELIKIYDVAEPNDSRSVRVTEMFPIKHSKARVIATAIKEVYRDLLSANDKDLADQKDKKDSSSGFGAVTYIRGNSDDDKEEEAPVKFKGLLSIGVDDTSNTLVVSTTAGLLENVRKIVENLDQRAASASSARVVQTSSRIPDVVLQKALQKILSNGNGGSGKSSQQKNRQNKQSPQQSPATNTPGGMVIGG